MKIKLNMKNVGNLFEPVPDDTYRVRISSWEDAEGDAGPYGKVQMMIVEGEFAETRALSENWSFAEKALWKTKEKLEAFSRMPWNDDDMDFDSDEFINLEAYVTTKQETYPKNDGTEGVKSTPVAFYSLDEMEAGESNL